MAQWTTTWYLFGLTSTSVVAAIQCLARYEQYVIDPDTELMLIRGRMKRVSLCIIYVFSWPIWDFGHGVDFGHAVDFGHGVNFGISNSLSFGNAVFFGLSATMWGVLMMLKALGLGALIDQVLTPSTELVFNRLTIVVWNVTFCIVGSCSSSYPILCIAICEEDAREEPTGWGGRGGGCASLQ